MRRQPERTLFTSSEIVKLTPLTVYANAEAEDRIQDLKASIASSSTVDPVSAECASLKATLSQTQADAKARRDELRSVLSVSNK